ncbi:MAG: ACT domain-containing protein [Acidobacteriota bacterium]|mgnify:CR=1 FL=1
MRFTLWPSRYGVAALASLPPLPGSDAGSPPLMVVQEAAEVTLVAPEEVLDTLGSKVLRRSQGWRALTLDGVFPLEAVGVLAALTRALAEARVPVMAFSSFGTDHLLVPEGQLGRALAALAQVSLPALGGRVSSPAVSR